MRDITVPDVYCTDPILGFFTTACIIRAEYACKPCQALHGVIFVWHGLRQIFRDYEYLGSHAWRTIPMQKRKILCLSFELSGRQIYAELATMGWEFLETSSIEEAGRLVAHHQPGVGLVLLTQPPSDNWQGIRELLALCVPIAWVALLPASLLEVPESRQLIARHFSDYQTLPLDVSRLSVVLGHLDGMSRLLSQVRRDTAGGNGVQMLGGGSYSQALLSEIRRAAALDEPMLIIGETGTEKELTARLIHRMSSRQSHAFSTLSCSNLPPNLVGGELFGQEGNGGSKPRIVKPGRLETAQGGTLFLDEVGELSQEMQWRLLDVLQRKRVRRIGGLDDITVDLRLIAASRSDLKEAVSEGNFLDELYQRLSVLTLELTPLRARGDDIELLAAHYLRLFMQEKERPLMGFTFKAIRAMREYDWPENTRELVHKLRRAIVMCQGDLIDASDLGFDPMERLPQQDQRGQLTLEQAKSVAEKEIIQITLKATENNISRAARHLAISRMTLYRLLDKHRIRSDWQLGG